MPPDPVTGELRRQPGPHVFVDDLDALTISDEDRHHLVRALRLRAGDPLTASDGAGRWRAARFADVLSAGGEVHVVEAPEYKIGLAIALTKSAKPELAVQKATEIGIDRITVFHADRSVARWDEAKRIRGLVRLERVAREAAMQSRQVRVPSIEFIEDLGAVGSTAALCRADFGGDAVGPGHRMIAIGPEGGWSEAEAELVPATVDLGRSVLRAETAAVVAATHMVFHRRG